MHSELSSTLEDFKATLEEVDILLDAANACTSDEEIKYATFNKSALLLLTGKFENFAETIAEQYVFIINSLELCPNQIPEVLRVKHTRKSIKGIESKQDNDMVAIIQNLGTLWATDEKFGGLSIDCTFSYGKHGEKELKKLFANIGIENIFDEVKIYHPEKSLLSDENLVDFQGIFNSITHMRNNILHQNATPDLTMSTVRDYRTYFEAFADELAVILNKRYLALSFLLYLSNLTLLTH